MLQNDESSQVAAVMKESGWYAGRQSDYSDYLNLLKTLGYLPTPKIIDILAECGGLCITRQCADTHKGWEFCACIARTCDGRAVHSADLIVSQLTSTLPPDAKLLMELFGQNVCPVGVICERCVTLKDPAARKWNKTGALYIADDGTALCAEKEWLYLDVCADMQTALASILRITSKDVKTIVCDTQEINARIAHYGLVSS